MDAEAQLQALLDQASGALDLGNTREALATLQKAAAIDADDPTLLMLQAMALTSDGKVMEALKVLDWAQEMDPDDVMVLMTRGNLLLDMLDDPYEALPCFEEAVQSMQEDRRHWGDEEPVRQEALRSLLHEALVQLSVCRGVVEDGVGAVQAVREALTIKPEDARTHVALARALMDVSDVEGAGKAAAGAAVLDAGLAEAHAVLGHVAMLQGRHADADAAFGKAAALNPEQFFLPAHMQNEVLLQEVRNDSAKVPKQLADYLARTEVRVEAVPPFVRWAKEDPPRSASAAAFTEGPRPPRTLSANVWDVRPKSITLYRVNLELCSRNAEELVQSAVALLVLEATAFLGMDLEDADEESPTNKSKAR